MNHKDTMLATGAAMFAGASGAEIVQVVQSILSKSFTWQEVAIVGVLAAAAVATNYFKYSQRK